MAVKSKVYSDPEWSAITEQAEKKAGIPAGFLHSIVNYGERSNADQVSEAGARTPYQIIPSTAKLIKKKYGIDPYLSPENSALGAALLLKESLDRNNGDTALAAAEYHGGTDRKNWGRKTKAYVGRVINGMQTYSGGGGGTGEVEQPQQTAEPTIEEIQAFYESGKMSPEAAAEYEADVQSGAIQLPEGKTIQPQQQENAEAEELPVDIAEAYASGKLSGEAARELEADVASGLVKMPRGYGVTETGRGVVGGTVEAITGAERATPETEALPDWSQMPEYQSTDLTDAAGWKASLGRVTAAPEEAVQILKANKPDIQARRDEKGNIIIRSGVDGKEYAVKPGFEVSDIPRTIVGGAMGYLGATSGGVIPAALTGAAVQGGVEASQAATGGNFDVADVAIAGGLNAAVPLVSAAARPVINAVAPKVMQGVNTVKAMGSRGAQAIPEAAPVGAGTVLRQADDVAQAVDNVAPAVPDEQIAAAVPDKAPVADIPASTPVQELSEDEFVALVRQADGGVGSQKAKERLAQSIPMNAEMKDIAEKYGYDLPIDVVSDSENLRQAMGGVRGIKLSPESIKWGGVKADVIDKTENLIQQLDGAKSVSEISEKVQLQLSGTQKALSQQTKSLYNDIEKAVPPNTPVSIPKTREVADQIIADRGEYVSPKIKEIAKMASDPKLTYAAAKDLKGEIGDVMSGAASKEPYGSTQVGQLKQLYKALADDQLDAVEGIAGTEVRDKLRLANTLTSQKKRLEKRIISGYGKDAEGGIGGKLTKAIKSGSSGDVTQLNKMIALLPPENRKEAIMSGIFSVVRDAKGKLSHEKFESFYGSLRKQTPIYSKIAKELTPDHEEFLRSFYVLSKKINAAENAVDKTGRANQLLMKMQAETITEKILASAGGQVATRAAGAVIPNPIMNTAINALTTAPSDKLLAAGKLLASPEFEALVVNPMKTGAEPSKAAIKKLAMSKVFSDFIKSVNMPRDLTAREKYITAMLQGGKGSVQETDQKGEF